MTWQQPRCIGDVPSRRSGHSFSIVGDFGYLFGGNDFRKPPGPNNELYKLDMSGNEFYWSRVETPDRCPGPRSHHTATVYAGTKILFFGGFKNSSKRYQDVWILDTTNDEWSQPYAGQTEVKPDGEIIFKRIWNDVPSPRGSHSASLVGNQLYIFGGYGGSGFARRDFNDVTILDFDTWEWMPVECTGEIPEPRSGHQAVPVQDKIYVIGGWNSMEQFKGIHILDTVSNTWSIPQGDNVDTGIRRWNHAAVSVQAVPYWKIFVFGGNSGDLTESGSNPQGSYLNDMIVYETGTDSWSNPSVLGKVPAERGETPMAYDPKGGRIVMFGGWANRWFGEVNVCKVAEVVGPPYSIDTIEPHIGPITGSTRCTITGMGFRTAGTQATVRFACIKGFIEVPAEVKSDTEVCFDSPSFEKYGPVNVECRVSVGGKSLTNSSVVFSLLRRHEL